MSVCLSIISYANDRQHKDRQMDPREPMAHVLSFQIFHLQSTLVLPHSPPESIFT